MTFFECYADETLLRCIGLNSKELRGGHSSGRSNVCIKLSKISDSLGLVDEDPNTAQDSYLKFLLSLNPTYTDQYLICSMDQKRNNRIAILRPNLEAWVVKIAEEKSIDLEGSKYRLSRNWRKLHDILRLQKNFQKREKFADFIKDASDHKSIIKLKEFIKI